MRITTANAVPGGTAIAVRAAAAANASRVAGPPGHC